MHNLGTPAVTVGSLRPVVAIDAAFWSGASAVERRVVLTHEHTHRRGAHGLLETAAVWLAAPLPRALADDLVGCVRRHLEAIADDAAARACGRHPTGRALARLPKSTIVRVNRRSFPSALEEVTDTALNVLSLPPHVDFDLLRRSREISAAPCLFIRDSGVENAFA